MSQATISLRPVGGQDDAFLRDVYAATRAEEMALVDWPATTKEAFLAMQFDAQARSYRANHPDADYCLVLVDGTPAGRLYVERRAHVILLLDIALLASHRNRGLGTRLVAALLEEGAARRVPVRLHVDRLNEHALAIYRRLGFRTVGDGDVHLLMEWAPATAARRPLASVVA